MTMKCPASLGGCADRSPETREPRNGVSSDFVYFAPALSNVEGPFVVKTLSSLRENFCLMPAAWLAA